MWLLDHNVPKQLQKTLESLSVESDTAANRGWQSLKNGELVQAASTAGFVCILTRDVEFAKTASRALKKHSSLAIVLITLRQGRAQQFCDSFLNEWKANPIQIKTGTFIEWPG